MYSALFCKQEKENKNERLEKPALLSMREKANTTPKFTEEGALSATRCQLELIFIPCSAILEKVYKRSKRHIVRKTSYMKSLDWKCRYSYANHS